MKSAMAWIKSNPITLAAALVALAAIGFFIYVLWAGSAFRGEVAKQSNTLTQVHGFGSKSVEYPSEDPDQPPRHKRLTINPATLDRLKSIQGRMDSEAKRIFAFADQRNHQGHPPLVPGLFPGGGNSSTRIRARRVYRDAFDKMLGPASPDATLPRLNAGPPPGHDRLVQQVNQAKSNYLSSINLFNDYAPGGNASSGSNSDLTPGQVQALRTQMHNRLIRTLRRAADGISIYADTTMNAGGSSGGGQYPFQIDPWSAQGSVPQPWQLWEGQLELWIQSDLARAIAIANHVGEPGHSVVTNPVKRLIAVRVMPGYVGLQTDGNTNAVSEDQRGGGYSGNRGRSFDVSLPNSPYPPPAGGRTGSPDRPIPINFNVSPTGRTSNGVYDVRHAVLSVIVDYQKLPQLLNAIGQVNFMTVLNVHITDVDEYAALRQGYVYGSGDAVRADLVVESLWLRDWTADLMPPRVKQYVGLVNAPTGGVNGRPPGAPGRPPGGRRRGRRH